MKRIIHYILLALCPAMAWASHTELPSDSLFFPMQHLSEVTIVCNPKVESDLFLMPASVTLVDADELGVLHASSIKDISAVTTNVFIPDYGSRLITSAYIRGIGSRINSPAVGLSVNNVPYLDKSAYDCGLLDVARIEVLRGPQGVLYGRNTMAGLINIYTLSPLDVQGTTIKMGAANYNTYDITARTAHKIAPDVGLSVAARYERGDGYATNTHTGKNSGAYYSAEGRFQLDARTSQRIKWSLTGHFEHSYQDGYPYASYDKTSGITGDVAYDSPSSYRRHLLTLGLGMEYRHDKFLLTSTTGYQYLNDYMRLDQDFTPLSIFTLNQRQRLHAFTQEVALRSTTDGPWRWVAGAFGSYQDLKTNAPVSFLGDGVQLLIEDRSNSALAALKQSNPTMPAISLRIANNDLFIDGNYYTPSYSLALFGQVEAHRILGTNLSATLGARVEYEHIFIDHNTTAPNLRGTATIDMGMMSLPVDFATPLGITGSAAQATTQFLPKLELKYNLQRDLMAYASIARGYRSGGYNYQMFSNLIQEQVRTGTITAVADATIDRVLSLMGDSPAAAGVAQAIKNIFAGMATHDDITAVDDAITYKPEHSWNYELGLRANFLQKRLVADLALFYIDCRDQQVSCVSGYGRITRNSGRTRSWGAEVALHAMPLTGLNLQAGYGFTHATFLQYDDGEHNYAGNFVPFAPMHSLSLAAAYTWEPATDHSLTFAAQCAGRGKIYWTEANDVAQPFYCLLDASLTYRWRWLEACLWGKNLTATQYQAFYFETINAVNLASPNSFVQQGAPITFGATIAFNF